MDMSRVWLAVASALLLLTPFAFARGLGLEPTPLCDRADGGLPAGPVREDAEYQLRVASFNVLHGLTDEGDQTLERRLEIQVQELADSGVDVVGLQEVSESTNHGRVIQRLSAELARVTEQTWYWCWFRTEPHAPGVPDTRPGGGDPLSDQLAAHYNSHENEWYEGAAVLSRWPILRAAAHRLPGEDVVGRLTGECLPAQDPVCALDLALEPRAAVWAEVSTPRGPLSVVAAHTSGNVDQHADLARWASDRSLRDRSAVIVCDCNAVSSSAAYAALVDRSWLDTYSTLRADEGSTVDQQLTATGPTVTERIDYVWLRGGSALQPVESERFMNAPVDGLWPSDHWGVLTTLR
ncbi:MAG: endonuclease/exonuclease/phosphatase family protein [Actinomycetota bacterium]